ncbi:alpha/beta hydrolase [Candidatus Enterovibrio altilux]|uniref:Phospholipase/carboxylesterase family protein n=1 Tax=Candidatus Enterovibrio altilux TaxID=1927128 RepID=A0A291BAX7_9GAMM|nr:alpha/beta fold hydrolase [Candidatus Enterovibrio luxaltus]ATF10168.1 phospholipase/carboxylesterase family protein [Candidatus Enterovibrio luxaltus]
MLQCVEIEPQVTATAVVIWLHGLGSNGHDFEALLPELKLLADAPVRFVFPHSPSISVTVNGGVVMPAWYDIFEMGVDHKLNTEQLLKSANQVTALIRREMARGIYADRIALVGFSQGGAVAYQAALSFPHALASLLVLSTYFPTFNSIKYASANRAIPIQIMHGNYDAVVLPVMGEAARDNLIAAGFTPIWSTYQMGHQICQSQIKDIAIWLTTSLAIVS